MNVHPSNNGPLSPVEQLENVYDSLADDVFDAPIEIDEETNRRASRIARDAMEKALGSGGTSESFSKDTSQPPRSVPDSPNGPRTRALRREERWFARRFGLHPLIAVVLTAVGLVFNLFAWGSLGTGVFIEVPLGSVVAFLTSIMQKRLYGDDNLTALFKGIAAGGLIIVPVPLAPFVFAPAGLLGWLWGRQLRETVTK